MVHHVTVFICIFIVGPQSARPKKFSSLRGLCRLRAAVVQYTQLTQIIQDVQNMRTTLYNESNYLQNIYTTLNQLLVINT